MCKDLETMSERTPPLLGLESRHSQTRSRRKAYSVAKGNALDGIITSRLKFWGESLEKNLSSLAMTPSHKV